MTVIIDLVVVALILIIALVSAKQGFVRVLVQSVGYILAGVLAMAISTPLANTTYDKFIEKPVVDAIVDVFDDVVEENNDILEEQIGDKNVLEENNIDQNILNDMVDQEVVDKVLDSLPDFLRTEEIESVTTSVTEFTGNISNYMSDGVEGVAKAASKDIVKPLACNIISLLYSLIILSILSAVVNFIAGVVDKKISIGKLGKYNHILGGGIGVIKGAFIVGIVCAVITLIVSFTGISIFCFTPENIEKTYIFEFLSDILFKFYK